MSLGRLKSTERSVDHGSLAHEVQRGQRTPSALGMGTIHVLCLVKNLVSCSSVPENPSEAEFEADGFPEGTCLGKYFPRVSTESFCCWDFPTMTALNYEPEWEIPPGARFLRCFITGTAMVTKTAGVSGGVPGWQCVLFIFSPNSCFLLSFCNEHHLISEMVIITFMNF